MTLPVTSRWALIAVGVVVGSGCHLFEEYEPGDPEPDIVEADTGSRDTYAPDTTLPDTAPTDTIATDLDGGVDSQTDAPTDTASDTMDADDATGDTDQIVDFRIVSPRTDDLVEYRLEVVRKPSKVEDGTRFEAEDNDSITARENTWLIDGATGTGPNSEKTHGDSFRWERVESPKYGIKCWSTPAPASDYTISVDGTVIAPSKLPEPVENCGTS